jgi:hypothetical protein
MRDSYPLGKCFVKVGWNGFPARPNRWSVADGAQAMRVGCAHQEYVGKGRSSSILYRKTHTLARPGARDNRSDEENWTAGFQPA